MKNEFTLDDGLLAQSKDLICWTKKLNADVAYAMFDEAIKRNRGLSKTATGHDVWRGDDITCWVLNYYNA